jgi:hypothetical protein
MGVNNPNLPSNVLSDEEAIQYLASVLNSIRTGLYTALTGSPTATAAQMVGGTTEVSGGTTATITTDTAANIIARMQALDANAAIGSTAQWRVLNDNSGALTVALGTGVTNAGVAGGLTIAAAASYGYLLKWTGANAVSLTRL